MSCEPFAMTPRGVGVSGTGCLESDKGEEEGEDDGQDGDADGETKLDR